jgi:Na+-transporting NADH:ubiquinone oxidoreductase subunit NqrB
MRRDPRHFQILFQSCFLLYGIFVFGWNEFPLYATYIGTSLGLQAAVQRMRGEKFDWRSPLISSFGLCLLLRTPSLSVAAFAAAVSILSKYTLRAGGRHIFNPSALGIVAAIAVTGNAWISPGQWGTAMVLVFAVTLFGSIVVTKAQRLSTTVAYLGTFAGLMFARQVGYLGWPLDHFVQTVSTGSLLIFSFFMITDPRTTPQRPVAAFLWASGVGAVAFYLVAFKWMPTAPMWVLVAAQPLVPVIDAAPRWTRQASRWITARIGRQVIAPS